MRSYFITLFKGILGFVGRIGNSYYTSVQITGIRKELAEREKVQIANGTKELETICREGTEHGDLFH